MKLSFTVAVLAQGRQKRIISWNVKRNIRCVDYALDYLGADLVVSREGKTYEFLSVQALGSDID